MQDRADTVRAKPGPMRSDLDDCMAVCAANSFSYCSTARTVNRAEVGIVDDVVDHFHRMLIPIYAEVIEFPSAPRSGSSHCRQRRMLPLRLAPSGSCQTQICTPCSRPQSMTSRRHSPDRGPR